MMMHLMKDGNILIVGMFVRKRDRLRFALVTLMLTFLHLELFNLEALCSLNEIRI